MGSSYGDLLGVLIDTMHADYRDTPERDDARLESLEYVVQTMLEKLRDQFDPR